MKKILIILGAIILAVMLAAGSFWGGMAYQSSKVNQARANFLNARGLPGDMQIPNGGQLPGGDPSLLGGGGTTGQVKTIDGNVLQISTAQDVITVNLSESTQVQKSESAVLSDLQAGMQVMVTGQRDSNGEINASQVWILDQGMPVITPTPAAPNP